MPERPSAQAFVIRKANVISRLVTQTALHSPWANNWSRTKYPQRYPDTQRAFASRGRIKEQRHIDLRGTTRQGTTGEAQANTVMHILGTLLNFAAANYEIDGKPIILVNPIKRLSNNRRWYPEYRRQTLIPDHKLPAWRNAVMSLRHTTVRDYLLLLLFTGLRRNEGATLRWADIDFDSKVLTVRSTIAKNGKEHRLPLSDFLFELLQRRYQERGTAEYVFPGRGNKPHLV